jgi:hypothetical protein
MAQNSEPVLKILDISLVVRHCKLDGEVLSALEGALSKSNYSFPVVKTSIKNYNINTGFFSREINNIYTGEAPGRISVFFTSHAAAAGDYNHDPFFFQNLDIREIFISVNSKRYPANSIKCNFGDDDYNQAYISLFQNLHTYGTNKSCGITRKQFKEGFTIFVFDLSKDFSFSMGAFNLKEQANINLSVTFGKGLAAPVSAFIFSESEKLISINKHREITFE